LFEIRFDVSNQIISFDTIIKTLNINKNKKSNCIGPNPNSSKIFIAQSNKILKDLEN